MKDGEEALFCLSKKFLSSAFVYSKTLLKRVVNSVVCVTSNLCDFVILCKAGFLITLRSMAIKITQFFPPSAFPVL